MKKYTNFRPKIKSRHPSHNILRKNTLPLFPFKSVIRLGSTTNLVDTTSNGGNRKEINTIQSIKNSSNKLLMKKCFSEHNVKTADWCKGNDKEGLNNLTFPIISKSLYGSRNNGNKKHDTLEDLMLWIKYKNLDNYIFEKYYNYSREYRLHISENGCFYTCRKMLKYDTPENDKWYRNDEHCVWIMEDNPIFDKPINWNEVIEESIKALKAVGLDIGAVDLRIQSATKNNGAIRDNPKFIIVEINSAPSFGEITKEKYIKELSTLLINK